MSKEFIRCKRCRKKTPKYKPKKFGQISIFCTRKCYMEHCKEIAPVGKGKNHPNWKGDKASYLAKHQWIQRNYGKADRCHNKKCKGKSIVYEWANLNKKYLRVKSHWMMLCKSCHNIQDRGNKCRRGHKLTKNNTYICPSHGGRACIKCIRMKSRAWWVKNGKKVLLMRRRLKETINEG